MTIRSVGRLTVTLLLITLATGCTVDHKAKPNDYALDQETSIFQDEPLVNLKPLPTKATTGNAVERITPAPAQSWIVSPADATLRRVLAKWATQAGWQLVWEATVDVPVTVTASFDGDFRTAVKGLFSSLSASEVNLTGLMYSGNRVLRVTESGRRAQ